MIPIRDDIPTKHPPVVTIVLIAVNVLAFLWQLSGDSFQGRLFELAAVPANVVGSEGAPIVYVEVPEQVAARMNRPFSPFVPEAAAKDIPAQLGITVYEQAIPAWLTILTSMFLHGSFGHLLFNMLFLWIFGNNIEDACGRVRFVLFYLATGVVATLAHVFSETGSPIPTIGASGAISGVLGGYLLLYPHARVLTVIPFFFLYLVHLPAKVFLLIWFGEQFLGLFGESGVAWWAHIGGFVAGLALVKLFESQEHRQRPKVAIYRPPPFARHERRGPSSPFDRF